MSFDNSWHHKEQFVWPKQFPLSINGKRQSPIDIREADAEKVLLPSFKLDLVEGDRNAEWTITNNGHTICVAPPSGVKWQLSGSMLKGKYILDHFHSHWGESCEYGCEHLIDGQKYAGETHFVFKWAPGQGFTFFINQQCQIYQKYKKSTVTSVKKVIEKNFFHKYLRVDHRQFNTMP